MSIMHICVCRDGATSDYESTVLGVTVIKTYHKPGKHAGVSGVDVITTDQGVFYRADCYAAISPYGWSRML